MSDDIMDRRSFFKYSGLIMTVAGLGWSSVAEAVGYMPGRQIAFQNMHTGEKFKGEYWYGGRYLPDAFKEIKLVMRDHRNGEVFPMDPRLMDIMYVLQRRLENTKGYEVFSGYRSPKTNAMLRRMSFGVARNSLHMQGQAVDLSLPGTRLRHLHSQAAALKAGGVGFYPESSFVHIDTGRVRQW